MPTTLGRRALLRFGAGGFALAMAPSMVRAASVPLRAGGDVRRVALHNLHTGDRFEEVYFADGTYVPDALAEAKRCLRDWRNGKEHPIDPRLFDVLHTISRRLETDAPFQIVSGYRSPETNAELHARSSGVATNSQHTLGKAVDVRIEGVDLVNLHRAALNARSGGVGFYPVSNFVHVDVGRVRQWTGA